MLEKEDKLNDVTRNYLQSSLRQIENALAMVYGENFDLRLISKKNTFLRSVIYRL